MIRTDARARYPPKCVIVANDMATLSPRIVGFSECLVLMSMIEQLDFLHLKFGHFADDCYLKTL
jgi:hypothetical protein